MQYTKHTFFKEICLFVLFVHFLLLLLLLCCDKGDFQQEKFVINTNNLAATVVFMPLHKRIPQKEKTSLPGAVSQARKVVSYESYQKALKSTKKDALKKPVTQLKIKPIVKPVAKKIVQIKKVAEIKKVVDLKKNKPVAPEIKKIVAPIEKIEKKAHKIVEVKEIKKDSKPEVHAQIKPVEKIAVEEKKVVEKTVMPDKITPIVVPKAVEQAREVKIYNDMQTGVVQADIDQSQDDEPEDIAVENLDLNLEDISFVGRYDLEKYEIEEKIKKEITKYWKSPVGISKTAVCELSILVGPDGKVMKVVIKKGSGSLAYDMSARAAVHQSHFPKEVYGKEFIIELGS